MPDETGMQHPTSIAEIPCAMRSLGIMTGPEIEQLVLSLSCMTLGDSTIVDSE